MISGFMRSLRRRLFALVTAVTRPAFAAHQLDAELASKSSYSLKVAQQSLFHQYQAMAKSGSVPSIEDTGYRVFSQFDEDGLLVFLFAVLGTHAKTFVDIGAGDGINSNCANLCLNFGWHGLFIDGNPNHVARGKEFYGSHLDTALYPPNFVSAMVNRANVNQIIEAATPLRGPIDLLSIDIDGNDYWVWDALECIQPRVVCVETHVELGMRNIVVPYDENYVYPGIHPDYHGASPVAMANLAARKGYRLVGANKYGFNTLYVQQDLAPDLIPEVPVQHVLRHPRNIERQLRFEAIKDLPYIAG